MDGDPTRLCVDSLTYGGRSDFPIAESWTERKLLKRFPTFSNYWYTSMKGLASVANTHGKSRVGAEAFTGSRGWVDHPYLIKGMGDEAFCNGVSHYVIHLSAHQPYERMKPGLTHRKWSLDFDPDWGTKNTLTLDVLHSWTKHSDPLVKYYSGTAIYRRDLHVSESGDVGVSHRLMVAILRFLGLRSHFGGPC